MFIILADGVHSSKTSRVPLCARKFVHCSWKNFFGDSPCHAALIYGVVCMTLRCARAVSVDKSCLAMKACEPFPPFPPFQRASPGALADKRVVKLLAGARPSIRGCLNLADACFSHQGGS